MKFGWRVTCSLRIVVAVFAVTWVTLPSLLLAQSNSVSNLTTSDPPQLDARAIELMRRSAQFLADQPALSFNWFVSYDEVIDGREKITFLRSGSNLLVRDKGFFSRAEGENGIREWRYDGRQVTFAAPAEKYYASTEFKQGFDALVDSALEIIGSEIPLYAIMRRGLPERLEEGLKGAAYLGVTWVAGQQVHHLAFSDEVEDWQVWISTSEEQPVPLVIVGTEPKKPGWPQYRAYITDWSFKPQYDAAVFKYAPAEGDVQISFPELKAKVAGTQSDSSANEPPPDDSATSPAASTEGQKQ
jgi:hypothetical protein